MRNAIPNKALSLAIAVLLLCMALPSLAKLSHGIYEHKERSCSSDTRLHFHTAEFDCEFQKFKVSTPFSPVLFAFKVLVPKITSEHAIPAYCFLSPYPILPFSLRAPPSLS